MALSCSWQPCNAKLEQPSIQDVFCEEVSVQKYYQYQCKFHVGGCHTRRRRWLIWWIVGCCCAAGERRLLDLARVNLGAARAELKQQRYNALAWRDLEGMLKWKCSRQAF